MKQFALAILLYSTAQLYAFNVVVDQNNVPQSNSIQSIYQMHGLDGKLSKGTIVTSVSESLTEYVLVPEEAGQTWKLDLFDFTGQTQPHYHKIQNQIVMILEGKLNVRIDDCEAMLLAGQYAFIPAGHVHALASGNQGVRFLVLDMPGFNYPKDRCEGLPLPQLIRKIEAEEIASPFFMDQSINLLPTYQEQLNQFPLLDAQYYQQAISQEGLTIYSLIAGSATNQRWSLALIEIRNATLPLMAATERLIVLNGELHVEMNGKDYQLTPGQSVRISPKTIHNIRAEGSQPVRLLRVSYST